MAKNDSETSPVVNSLLPDSVDGRIQSLYERRGLNYISNNTNIIPRDDAGNIVLQSGAIDNPLLIIDAVTEQFTNASVLKVLDTQFKYFKFPARTTVIEEEPVDLDFDLDIQLQDPIFARYQPSEDRKILLGPVYSGILMDNVQDGLPQQSPNMYTISKEIKNSGVDLRFRIKLQHRYDAPDPAAGVKPGFGTAYFSLIKSGDDGINRSYRTFANTSTQYSNTEGSIVVDTTQDLIVDIVIPNSEFKFGDRFGIGAQAGQNNNTQYHTIDALQSYWVISDASKNVDLRNQEIQLPIVNNTKVSNDSAV